MTYKSNKSYIIISFIIKKEIAKMHHSLTNHNKIIANNLLAQQYTQN